MLNPFYRYYDLLFEDKDYPSEIDAVLKICSRYGSKQIRKVLEIGCGTGNHTIEIAKRGVLVTANDIDKQMIKIAREKVSSCGLKNVRLLSGSIRQVERGDFDLSIGLFNVITYIPDTKSLNSLFCAVSRALRKGGIFIFDCWNGIAAIKSPPRNKVYKKVIEGNSITCRLYSQTDLFLQKTVLKYSFEVLNKKSEAIEKGAFSFQQTLWTPMQVASSVESAGFKVLEICQPFKLGFSATPGDWKVMFICKK